jgi:hypothetical protein
VNTSDPNTKPLVGRVSIGGRYVPRDVPDVDYVEIFDVDPTAFLGRVFYRDGSMDPDIVAVDMNGWAMGYPSWDLVAVWDGAVRDSYLCRRDGHAPADVGMRASWCSRCETPLVFENWAWVEDSRRRKGA